MCALLVVGPRGVTDELVPFFRVVFTEAIGFADRGGCWGTGSAARGAARVTTGMVFGVDARALWGCARLWIGRTCAFGAFDGSGTTFLLEDIVGDSSRGHQVSERGRHTPGDLRPPCSAIIKLLIYSRRRRLPACQSSKHRDRDIFAKMVAS